MRAITKGTTAASKLREINSKSIFHSSASIELLIIAHLTEFCPTYKEMLHVIARKILVVDDSKVSEDIMLIIYMIEKSITKTTEKVVFSINLFSVNLLGFPIPK